MKLTIKDSVLLIQDANNRDEIIINSDIDIMFDMPLEAVNLEGLSVTAITN